MKEVIKMIIGEKECLYINNYGFISKIKVYEINGIEKIKGEIFVDLESSLYPDIKPIYKISNKNRVYSTSTNKLLSTKIKKHGNGYYQVSLQCGIPGTKYTIARFMSMHRLMMVVFNSIPNMGNLVVNHIDGDKSNNDLSNLEWVTYSRNTRHAIETGLYKPKKGEECSYATIDEKTVRKICEMMLSGKYSKKEIAKKLGIPKSTVVNVTNGGSWTDITKDYDMTSREVFRAPKGFTVDDLHMFCKYFVTHPIGEKESVRKYILLAIQNTNFIKNESDMDKIYYTIRSLYERKSYTKISEKYSY